MKKPKVQVRDCRRLTKLELQPIVAKQVRQQERKEAKQEAKQTKLVYDKARRTIVRVMKLDALALDQAGQMVQEAFKRLGFGGRA